MASLRIIYGQYVLDWCEPNGKRHRQQLGKVGVLPRSDAERIVKRKNLELSAGYRMLNPERVPAGRSPLTGSALMTVKYVLMDRFADLTEYTVKEIRRKLERGEWRQNIHWVTAPDGHPSFSLEAYARWVEGVPPIPIIRDEDP